MKKLVIGLLLTLSTQAFAQKNEIVLSPGVVYYQGRVPYILKSILADQEGAGWRISAAYLRNIKWLQLGASVEYGKFSYYKREMQWIPGPGPDAVTVVDKVSVADPFVATHLLANFRVPFRRFQYYAGAAAGYLAGTARRNMRAQGHFSDDYERDIKGLSLGGQAGASYKLLPMLSLSADITMRYADISGSTGIPVNSPEAAVYFDRLTYYGFSVGAHYLF